MMITLTRPDPAAAQISHRMLARTLCWGARHLQSSVGNGIGWCLEAMGMSTSFDEVDIDLTQADIDHDLFGESKRRS